MDEIEAIRIRNQRVEADKAWEGSWTRRFIIMLLTYLIIGLYLSLLKIEQAWLHALVPATGYILSTFGLGYVKEFWIKNCYKKEVAE